MILYYATSNSGKVQSLKRSLAFCEVTIEQAVLELSEPQTLDVAEIARCKAKSAFAQLGKPVVVQDSGFCMDDWSGFPGAFVRYALETLGIEGLLKLAEGTSRRCAFHECLAYMDEERREPKLFRSIIPGTLAQEPRGQLTSDAWSGLQLVFIPGGRTKTLAEMTEAERNQWRYTRSVRRNSAVRLGKWLISQGMTTARGQ
ncbi:MAG: deoxyribonucleotide triphosphate pyrophosphatase [Microgenomates group bacterium GW2011_GWC2_46_7]|nr:MAG: deoxyribonucleotide triphosphate pyrophosphatase [Microgenomates group bacterium GW2011_GWC2_46_7]